MKSKTFFSREELEKIEAAFIVINKVSNQFLSEINSVDDLIRFTDTIRGDKKSELKIKFITQLNQMEYMHNQAIAEAEDKIKEARQKNAVIKSAQSDINDMSLFAFFKKLTAE